MSLPIYNLDAPVGDRQPNRPDDVRLVQELMNVVARTESGWAPSVPLPVDGTYSANLKSWILAFQQRSVRKNPQSTFVIDGKINPLPMQDSRDWVDHFAGGVSSTMYTLNFRSWKGDKVNHIQLGLRLHLRDGKNGAMV